MELALWTYEGPPHVGAMRVANSCDGIHYVLHAPQGDTYADLLFTMIERNKARPPVTYTTFQARDLGGDTAGLFKQSVQDAYDRFKPDALLVGASCTAELIQDDPGGLAQGMGLPVPVVPLELPSYQRKENWGAAETLYHLARGLADKGLRPGQDPDLPPSCNIIGPSSMGFRGRDNVVEIVSLLEMLGVRINVVAPWGAAAEDFTQLGAADFNVLLYPEVGQTTVKWLERTFGQPYTRTIPIGVGATQDFIKEVCALAGVDPQWAPGADASRLPWYSKSIDSTYLTGKRVFIFGDSSHATAMARVARDEMGFDVVGLGTYSREFAKPVRALAANLGLEPLITDDYLEVEAAIQATSPELVLGTQMERHIAKRLGIGCAVISAPVHVQDFPARFSPTMGFEGANVLFDTLIHPLVMGLEEHLLGMFREDFEFNDEAMPSHLAGDGAAARNTAADAPQAANANEPEWEEEAARELKKIPFFVRGKARRNTEAYAHEQGLTTISVETLYDAKAHYSR